MTDTLTTITGHESVVFSRGDAWALWGKSPHMAVCGGRVYLGSADSLEYRIHAPDGRLERLVRVPGRDLTLSDEEIRAGYEVFVPDPSDIDDITREIMDEQRDRTHRPAYRAMVVDTDGNVWLEGYQGRHELEEPRVWQVFDASGEWLGPVTLPPRFQVFRIGPGWILGMRPDELDVQHIQLLPLSRG